MRQRRFLIRLPAALTVLAFLLVQTGCSGLLPRQTDAADEAILRVAALSRAGEELTLTAMTTGIKTGESSEPPETLEGLRLRLAELRQAGLSGEDAAALCRKLYEEGCE